MPRDDVHVNRAIADDAPLIARLLELYTHDLSDVFPHVVLDDDGRFGYPHLAEYWTAADRHALVFRTAGRVAGFALVTGTHDAGFDMTEFFVLKQFRGTGVGRCAAQLLWTMLPGRWTVRVSVRNASAQRFWAAVISRATDSPVDSSLIGDWRHYRFTPRTAT